MDGQNLDCKYADDQHLDGQNLANLARSCVHIPNVHILNDFLCYDRPDSGRPYFDRPDSDCPDFGRPDFAGGRTLHTVFRAIVICNCNNYLMTAIA